MSVEVEDNVYFSLDDDAPSYLSVGKTLHNANVRAFLKDYPYDPYQHNGARNPYTGDIIVTEEDYKKYVHEYTYCRECDKVVKHYYNDYYNEQINSQRLELENCQQQLKISEENCKKLDERADYLQKEVRRLHGLLTPENKLKRDRETCILYIVCFALFIALVVTVIFYCNAKNESLSINTVSTQSRVEENLATNPPVQSTFKSQKQSSSTPAPQKQSGTSQSNGDSSTVYITNSGSKYHKKGCQYLSKSSKSIDLSKAKKQGYEPCSKCY